MRRTIARYALVVAGFVAGPRSLAVIDAQLAKRHFNQASSLARNDGGKFWGVELGGPMIFADPSTREVVANQQDRDGVLIARDGVFVGHLPETVGIANTAVEWAGTRWTMIMWPLPSALYSRGRLMMHESFHRVQDLAGLPAASPANSHMDTKDGRLYLRLEWRALDAALLCAGEARRVAARDALLFRAARLSRFPKAADEERALNMNEGLAEYTGWMLCGLPHAAAESRVALALEQNEWNGPFSKGFSYTTGPAYGFLLDAEKPEWRTGLTDAVDLPDILAAAISWSPPADPVTAAGTRLDPYHGRTLADSEEARERAAQQRRTEWRAKYLDSKVVIVPLSPSANYTYDPNGVEGYDDTTSVYDSIRVVDEWGVLVVTEGAMVPRKNGVPSEVLLAASTVAGATSGPGWTIELKQGWVLKPGARAGDLVVTRNP